MPPDPIIHLELTPPDTTVRRWGTSEINAGQTLHPITAKVLGYSDIFTETLADRYGTIPSPGFSVQLADTTREVRGWAQTANRYLLNRFAQLLVEEYGNRQLDIAARKLTAGYLVDWSYLEEMIIEMQFADILGSSRSPLSLLRTIPKRTITKNMFPGAPEESLGRPVPIYYGEHSDDYTWSLDNTRIPVGLVPGIYVGQVGTFNIINAKQMLGTNWGAYLIAGHALADVQSQFMWSGEKDDEGNVILSRGRLRADYPTIVDTALPTQAWWLSIYFQNKFVRVQGTDGTIEDYGMAFIQGPRNHYAVHNGIAVSYNIGGVEDIGDGNGVMICDAAHQLAHFICYWIFGDYRSGNWGPIPAYPDLTPKFNRTSVDLVKAIHDARLPTTGYKTAFAVGANGSDAPQAAQILADLQVGMDIRLGKNHHGQMFMFTFDDTADVSDLVTFDSSSITNFTVDPDPDYFANAISWDYGPEPATGRVSGIPDRIEDAISIANWGETREAPKYTNIATYIKEVARDVANRQLAVGANVPMTGSFETAMRGTSVRAGQLVRVTSEFGLGSEGWTDRVLLVTAVVVLGNDDQMLTRLQWEDVHELLEITALQASIFVPGGLATGIFWGDPIGSEVGGTAQPLGSEAAGTARRLR